MFSACFRIYDRYKGAKLRTSRDSADGSSKMEMQLGGLVGPQGREGLSGEAKDRAGLNESDLWKRLERRIIAHCVFSDSIGPDRRRCVRFGRFFWPGNVPRGLETNRV